MSEGQAETLKKVYRALKKSQQRVKELEDSLQEPIAIIGSACRFPGGAQNAEAFWQLLSNQVDAVTPVPEGRWGNGSYYDKDPDAPGKTYTTRGAYLAEPIDQFDAGFFEISPSEAKSLDPQQRLLLEVSWEALENSGVAMGSLKGTNAGVFIGIAADDYTLAHRNSNNLDNIDAYSLMGTTASTASGRIAYFYGFEGPTISIDTACSSSLVAFHLASQSLRQGEADMMLVGSANLMIAPSIHVCFSKLRAISPEGKCKTFDANADGYVRGEGCGFVVLKRLSDALRDNNPVLAVIKGSAVNQDGRSSGLAAPNGAAQEEVIRKALKNAALDIADIDYIETHGTGTVLGDPIEVDAIGKLLRRGSAERKNGDLLIGSVKTNVGHLEAASGMAGLIKLLLAFKHKKLPASLHFNTPNPHIPWDELPLKVVDRLIDWNKNDEPRRASISAFGFSGTNAHVILEEYAVSGTALSANNNTSTALLTLSAKTPEALTVLQNKYIDYLTAADENQLAGICQASNNTRMHFNYRMAVIGNSCAQLRNNLQQATGMQVSKPTPDIGFIFSGQLADSPSVQSRYEQLFSASSEFREAFTRCDLAVQHLLNHSLLDGLQTQAEKYLPLFNFSLQFSLAQFWLSHGVVPNCYIGVGFGRYAAICVAGMITPEAALQLLMMQCDRDVYSSAQIAQVIASLELLVPLATVYSANNSLPITTLDDWLSYWQPNDDHRAGAVNLAANMMKCMDEKQCTVSLDIGSSSDVVFHPHHDDKVTRLPGLQADVNTAIAQDNEWRNIQECLASLYRLGFTIRWSCHEKNISHPIPSDLPNYPFQRKGYWRPLSFHRNSENETTGNGSVGYGKLESRHSHPLIDERLSTPLSQQIYFNSRLSADAKPFLLDHQVFGEIVVSAASHLSLMLGAVADIANGSSSRLDDVLFLKPLVIQKDGHGRQLQLLMTPIDLNTHDGHSHEQYELKIVSYEGVVNQYRDIQTHVSAKVSFVKNPETISLPETIATIKRRCVALIDPGAVYKFQASKSIDLGASYRWISEISCGHNEAICKFEAPAHLINPEAWQLHPGLIDSCFGLLVQAINDKSQDTYIPFSVDAFSFTPEYYGAELWAHAIVHQKAQPSAGLTSVGDTLKGDVVLLNADGHIVAQFYGLEARRVTPDAIGKRSSGNTTEVENNVYQLLWEPKPSAAIPAKTAVHNKRIIVLSTDTPLAGRVRGHLQSQGFVIDSVIFDERINQSDSTVLGIHGEYRIAPDSESELHRVLQLLKGGHETPVDTIVHCCFPAQGKDVLQESVDQCIQQNELAAISLLHLAKGVVKHFPFANVWTISAGLFTVNDDVKPSLDGATFNGFVRAINSEIPDLVFKQIDLAFNGSGNVDVAALDMLTAMFLQPKAQEAVTALANGQQYIQRLVALDQQDQTIFAAGTTAIRADASYLIVGGLGALGFKTAQWLIEQGARHILLAGRSIDHIPAEIQQHIHQFSTQGITIECCVVDITNAAEVAQLFSRIASQYPPLAGIVHSAGVLEDAVLEQQTQTSLLKVLAAKLSGSWLLHKYSQHLPLDFFVLYSSSAGLLGSPGQSNYAAANSFLDQLSVYRKSQGLASFTINWGPWAGSGMATKVDRHSHRLEAIGLSSISDKVAREVFYRSITPGQKISQICCMNMHWEKYFTYLQSAGQDISQGNILTNIIASRRSKSSTVAHQNPVSTNSLASENTSGKSSSILRLIRDVTPTDARLLMTAEVEKCTRQVSGSTGVETISTNRPLVEQGFDSLMSVELRNVLNKTFDIKLHSSVVFDYPTIEKLSDYILQDVLAFANNKTEPVNQSIVAPIEKFQRNLVLDPLAVLDELDQLLN
jgi:acyl transferase domain-containing protein/acyl carrier protein